MKKGILHGGQKKYLQFQTSNIPDRLRMSYRITMVKILIIQSTFYEQELQKTTQDVYRTEKVIKSKGNKVLVKWRGYPEEFNSWVDKNELIDL